MGRKTSLAILLVVISLIGAGCVFFSTPPDPGLTKPVIDSILECQEQIKKKGRAFIEAKLGNLEDCLDKVLKIQLLYENNLITESEFETRLAATRQTCLNKYNNITGASFTLANDISAKCQPAIIYTTSYDPLQFQALASATGISITNGNELGGAICKAKEAIVDIAVGLQVPRMHELLGILGLFEENGLYDFYVEKKGIRIPNIVLHDKCQLIFVDNFD